ncbi:MAG: DUF4240 domain-containing protein [Bacteroidetes bacterium]|nr:DUF4240 domain-containing protein [Bacteroidota bacterium]
MISHNFNPIQTDNQEHLAFWTLIQDAQSHNLKGRDFMPYFERSVHSKQPNELIELMKSYLMLHKELQHPALPAADWLINGYTSDDGLTDFKNWIISKGREVYTSVQKDPDNLISYVSDSDARMEVLPYIISERYEVLTGKSIYQAIPQVQSQSRIKLKFIDELTAKEHCPNLFAHRASELQKRRAMAQEVSRAFSLEGLSPEGRKINGSTRKISQSQDEMDW